MPLAARVEIRKSVFRDFVFSLKWFTVARIRLGATNRKGHMTLLDTAMLPFDPALIQSAGRAYIVGGTTRDLLLGKTPADYDIAVQGNPEKYARAIGRHMGGRLVPMGKPGKMVYRFVAGKIIVDITPLRGPGIQSDLALRDFTINAMAVDLATGALIDPLDGRQDLAARTVRMVSEGAFEADPLRLLRAFRMAACLAFTLTPDTLSAITGHATRIRLSAGERIREELFKILATPHSHRHLGLMNDCGLLGAIFPELNPLRGCVQNRHHSHDVLTHTLAACEQLETLIIARAGRMPFAPPDPAVAPSNKSGHNLAPEPTDKPEDKKIACLKFAVLLHDTGKPACKTVDAAGGVHFYGHEKAGVKAAAAVCDRIRCSREEHRFVASIISLHTRPLQLFHLDKKKALSNKAVTRLFMTGGDDIPYLLLHAAADMLGKGNAARADRPAFMVFLKKLAARFYMEYTPRKAGPALLTGQDLIQEFGLSPSPLFADILQQVEEARLSEKQMDRPAALSLVSRFLESMKQESP